MSILRLLLKRKRLSSSTGKRVLQRQMPFLQNLIVPPKELPRTPECIHAMFEARGAISCSVSPSIWHIAKLPVNLRLLLSPTVGEGLDIGKNG